MSAHIAGPWTLDGSVCLVGDVMEEGQHALYCADIRQKGFTGAICTIQSADHCPPHGITRDMAEANARLIAAAPELLKACQQALYDLKGREHDKYLRDAIAKATEAT